jgi:hypothetical protein
VGDWSGRWRLERSAVQMALRTFDAVRRVVVRTRAMSDCAGPRAGAPFLGSSFGLVAIRGHE